MPNHVKNILKMKGISELPIFRADEDGNKALDFNALIPMPVSLMKESGSWETTAIEAVLTAIHTPLRKEWLNFSYTPRGNLEERINRMLEDKNCCANTREELIDCGLQYLRNAALYGSTSWYHWCINNWGTKWNAYECDVKEDVVEFETAWSCPEPIIKKLAEMYPDIEIEHMWADEDMGNNSGCVKYYKGKKSGGYDSEEQEAFERYIECWGETNCLYKGEDGNWIRRECSDCPGC